MSGIPATIFKDSRFIGYNDSEVFSTNRFNSIDMTSAGTSSCQYESVYHAMNGEPGNAHEYRLDFCDFIENLSEDASLASQLLGQNEAEVSLVDSNVLKEMYSLYSSGRPWPSRSYGDICVFRDIVLKDYVKHSRKTTSGGDSFSLHYMARKFNLLIRVLEPHPHDNSKYTLWANVCVSSDPENCRVLYLLHTREEGGRRREHYNCLVPILRNIGTHTNDTRRYQAITDGNRSMRRRL